MGRGEELNCERRKQEEKEKTQIDSKSSYQWSSFHMWNNEEQQQGCVSFLSLKKTSLSFWISGGPLEVIFGVVVKNWQQHNTQF